MTEPTSPMPDTENNTKMWGWDDSIQQWVLIGTAPILPPLPDAGKSYKWDEATKSWVEAA